MHTKEHGQTPTIDEEGFQETFLIYQGAIGKPHQFYFTFIFKEA